MRNGVYIYNLYVNLKNKTMPFIALNVWGTGEPTENKAGNFPKAKGGAEQKKVKAVKKPKKIKPEKKEVKAQKVETPKQLKGKAAKAKKDKPLALTILRAAIYVVIHVVMDALSQTTCFGAKQGGGDRRGVRCKRRVNPNPGEAPCSTENKKKFNDFANGN